MKLPVKTKHLVIAAVAVVVGIVVYNKFIKKPVVKITAPAV